MPRWTTQATGVSLFWAKNYSPENKERIVKDMENTSSFRVNDIVEATDQFGNYSQEKGVVVGFELNDFGRLLVKVKLDCCRFPGYKKSVFYPSELTLLERPAPLFPEK